MSRLLSVVLVAALSTAAFTAISARAQGAEIGVTPVTFTLGKGANSGMLTVENHGTDPIRLQISVTSWTMDERGQMHVEPTDDLVAFPGLVTMMPHEKRAIRFGVVNNTPSDKEKTYRIFLQELPSLESSLGKSTGETFTIHTTFGIPIFIPPAASVKKVDVSDVGVSGGRVHVTFTNSGTVHTSVSEVRIDGKDSSGHTLFSNVQHGWYVLAENDRLFEAKLQPNECAKLANLTATVYSDAGTATKSVSVSGTCK